MTASMHVSSYMHLVSMLMHNACISAEAAAENRHLRTWLSVLLLLLLLHYYYYYCQYDTSVCLPVRLRSLCIMTVLDVVKYTLQQQRSMCQNGSVSIVRRFDNPKVR